jgi:hypothetical protein
VPFEGIHPKHLYQMDGIISNFEHILDIFDANVIKLHLGQAGPRGPKFGLEKWKLKLPSVEQMRKNPNFSIGCVHRVV